MGRLERGLRELQKVATVNGKRAVGDALTVKVGEAGPSPRARPSDPLLSLNRVPGRWTEGPGPPGWGS